MPKTFAIRALRGLWLQRMGMPMVAAVLLCLITTSGASSQSAPPASPVPVTVPEVYPVQAPDGVFLLSVPPGMCLYPNEVTERFSNFTTEMQTALLAGECGRVADLIKNGKSVVEQAVAASIMDSDVDPATRRTEAQLLNGCREWFGSNAGRDDLKASVAALNRYQGVIKDVQDVPLGLRRSDEHAVYGGSVGLLEKGDERVLQVKIIACFAPAKYPILWLFEDVVPQNASMEQIDAEATAIVSVAAKRVVDTMRLNDAALRKPAVLPVP